MTAGAIAGERLRHYLRRVRDELVHHIGPVTGLGLGTLLHHPVWTECSEEGRGLGVVVVPGFAGADIHMAVLRRWLARRGYRPVGAALAMNLGCTTDLVGRLERRVEDHVAATGGPVVLLGHSRGGWLGRLIAVRRPELVCGLVMVGSPVLDPLDAQGPVTVLLRVLVRLSGLGVRGLLNIDCLDGQCRDTTMTGLAAPLQVPALAVYSRLDGVVGWESCRDPEAEWVEVHSTHGGMSIDPELYVALAPRLAGWARARCGPRSSAQ
jgi:hypothetical protein